MAMRVLVTDGMDAGALAKLREDGFEMVEQFYEPDELGVALREFDAVTAELLYLGVGADTLIRRIGEKGGTAQ